MEANSRILPNVASAALPCDNEIEACVLGSVILESAIAHRFLALIPTADIFYSSAHKNIYRAIESLVKENITVDLLTMADKLRKMRQLESIGGAYYLTQLTSAVASSANIEYHCQILIELWMRRVVLAMSATIKQNAIDKSVDILDLVAALQMDLLKISARISTKTEKTAKELVDQVITEIIHNSNNPKSQLGIQFGFEVVDKHFGGFQKSDLIILAARPSMGKTTFALHGFLNACTQFGHKGLFFSLEMSDKQLVKKMLANRAGLTTSQLNRGHLQLHEIGLLEQAGKDIGVDSMIILDSGAMTFEMMRSKIYTLKASRGIDFVVIDYLQLISLQKEPSIREQEIAKIARGLKGIAQDLEIPIITLAQLSRKVEERSDKRPLLSDLRESGAIEQDADVVVFLYRPEYYQIKTTDDGMTSTENMCELIVAKHRNGPVDTLLLGFNGKNSAFYDWDKF